MGAAPQASGPALRVAVLLAGLALSACAAPGPDDPSRLMGRAWRLAQIEGQPVAAPDRSTLAIAPDGAVSGDAGCNRYAGRVDATGSRLAFSPLAATKRACAAAVTVQEQRMLDAFERTAAWRLDDAGLTLLDRAGRPLLLFAPAGD